MHSIQEKTAHTQSVHAVFSYKHAFIAVFLITRIVIIAKIQYGITIEIKPITKKELLKLSKIFETNLNAIIEQIQNEKNTPIK